MVERTVSTAPTPAFAQTRWSGLPSRRSCAGATGRSHRSRHFLSRRRWRRFYPAGAPTECELKSRYARRVRRASNLAPPVTGADPGSGPGRSILAPPDLSACSLWGDRPVQDRIGFPVAAATRGPGFTAPSSAGLRGRARRMSMSAWRFIAKDSPHPLSDS